MPLLTVRLTDEDYAALKELAGGSSMAELVRAWIAGTMPEVPMAVWATRDRAEAAEAKVLELEAEVKRLKKELAGRPGPGAVLRSEVPTRRADPVVLDLSPTAGPPPFAPPARFGAPKPAPKPGKKAR